MSLAPFPAITLFSPGCCCAWSVSWELNVPLAGEPLNSKRFLNFPGDLCSYCWTLPRYVEAKEGVMKRHFSWTLACLRRALWWDWGRLWCRCCLGFLGFAHLLLHSRSSCCVFSGVPFPDVCGKPIGAGCDSANHKLVFPSLSRDAIFTKPSIVPLSFSWQ